MLLCAASGCAQIFGLDTTTGPPDANLERASLQMQRVSIGATVQKNPLDLTGQTATFYQDDGAGGLTKTAGELGPMNTFSAPINTGNPPVLFTLPMPDTAKHYWALPARGQKGNFIVYEHPNPEAADPAAKIMLSATLPSPYVTGESFGLIAIGPWTQHTLAATELPMPDMAMSTIATTLDYSAFTPTAGNTIRARITGSDYVFLLREKAGLITGVLQTQFEQTAGTDMISGPITAVTADKTLNASIDPTGYSTRYSAVRPAPMGLAMSYNITAAPGWSVAATVGITLKSGGSAMTDTSITGMYANPFESLGWKSLLVFSTSTSRMTPFTYMGMPVGLNAGMTQVLEEGSSNSIGLAAGLPITIRVNSTALTTDGMNLALDLTKAVEVTADIDKTATPTAIGVTLDEVQANGSRKTVVDAITTPVAGQPAKVTLPPDAFEVGKTYVIRFRTWDGAFTGAATGDLQTISLPFSTSYLDGGVFTVTP